MANYTINHKKIRVFDKEFDIKATLECGQVFRYEEYYGGYRVFSQDKSALITSEHRQASTEDQCESESAPECVTHVIETDDPDYFVRYFDLERDYNALRAGISADGFIGEAAEYGKGIRILRQDCIEVIISFLISANNNIKRIQSIINRLCESAGRRIEGGYAFPDLNALAGKDEAFYRNLGCGYRSSYLAQTVPVLKDINEEALQMLSTPEIKSRLLAFKGVGEKVASCILLYGFCRWDIFPVDTWIYKVYNEQFNEGDGASPSGAEKYFIKRFGVLSGLIQQYMFYFRRNK